MHIKEVSSIGLEPHESAKLIFSGYDPSLNVVCGGSKTQIENFVKTVKFVSGVIESRELLEEGITNVEAEIVFDISDTRTRSTRNRRPRLVTVKRQLFEDGTDRYRIDNSRAQKSRLDELLSSLKRSLQYAYLTEGNLCRATDMPPEELLSMFSELVGAREIESKKSGLVNKLDGMNNDLNEAQRTFKEMIPQLKILRKERKTFNEWNREISRLERLFVASEYVKARDDAAEDTYEISLELKRIDEMIEEYNKNLEEAQQSLSQLNAIRAEVDVSLNRVATTSAQLVDAERLLSETSSKLEEELQSLETVKKGNAKLMISAIKCSASLQQAKEEVAESKRDLDQLQKKKQVLYDQLKQVLQKFISKLKGKGIVLTEEALLMFHLEYHDEKANLLKAEYIQVGSQIETAKQNLIRPETALADLESQLQGLKGKQRSSGKEQTNVNRQIASLKSKVEGLEQKVEFLKNDLNEAISRRDAEMENLSSCPPSPPIYKRMVNCHTEISVLQESRKTLTQKEDHIRSCMSKMDNLTTEHPWINSCEHLFGTEPYDYINEDPATAWETCQELRIQKTYNGIPVNVQVQEPLAKAEKDHKRLKTNMKRIKRDIALLQTEIVNTEEERTNLIEASFVDFRSAFQAISSTMLPDFVADLTPVGSSIVDHGFQICYTGQNIASEAFTTRRLIGTSFLLTIIQFLKGTFFTLIEGGDHFSANETQVIHNTLQTHLKDVQVVVFSENAEAWVTGNVISCWASSSSGK